MSSSCFKLDSGASISVLFTYHFPLIFGLTFVMGRVRFRGSIFGQECAIYTCSAHCCLIKSDKTIKEIKGSVPWRERRVMIACDATDLSFNLL